MSAVCDSGPLIHLSRIGKIDLLRKLFGSVWITDSTYSEVVEEGRALGKSGVSAIEQAIEEGWIRLAKLEPQDQERAARLARSDSLEEGDAKAIILAQKSGRALITNDRLMIRSAKSLGVDCMWTTSLLLKAVKERAVTGKEALLILRRLAETGLHMRLEVYESLRTAIEQRSQ
jgi:predicted nucleic acid-binding protein